MPSTCVLFLAICPLLAAESAPGRKPEVSNIFPDFPCTAPRTITGEDFDPQATEVWAWDLGRREEADAAGQFPPATLPALPAEPPKEARRIAPLDVERQVLVARVPSGIVWVRTPGGCSTPYLVDVPRPFWLSEPRGCRFGGVHVRVRPAAEYRECRVALRSGQTAVAARLVEPARSYRTADRNLVHFEIPASLVPGDYEVWIHNGLGGVFGWQSAGTIAVAAPQPAAPRVFDVREFGDGVTIWKTISRRFPQPSPQRRTPAEARSFSRPACGAATRPSRCPRAYRSAGPAATTPSWKGLDRPARTAT